MHESHNLPPRPYWTPMEWSIYKAEQESQKQRMRQAQAQQAAAAAAAQQQQQQVSSRSCSLSVISWLIRISESRTEINLVIRDKVLSLATFRTATKVVNNKESLLPSQLKWPTLQLKFKHKVVAHQTVLPLPFRTQISVHLLPPRLNFTTELVNRCNFNCRTGPYSSARSKSLNFRIDNKLYSPLKLK